MANEFSTKSIQAIILAAGEGTRLRPYTLDRPKCLVEIEGRSLLDRQIAVLRSESIEPIIVVGGYKAQRLEREDIILRHNPRFAETNMVWTLFCVEEELKRGAIVSYGDILYSKNILRQLLASTADIAVTIDLDWESYWRARNEDPLADAETLKLDATGAIIELGRKPGSLQEIQGQYMGLVKYSAAGVEQLRTVFHRSVKNGELAGKPVEKAYMTDLLQAVINAGYRVQSVPIRGEWLEVDSVSDLQLPLTLERARQCAGSVELR